MISNNYALLNKWRYGEKNGDNFLVWHIVTWEKTYLFNICRKNEWHWKQSFPEVKWIISDGKKNILVWPRGMRVNAIEFSKKVKFQRLSPYIFYFKVLSSNSHLNRKSNMFQRHNCASISWNRTFWRKYQRFKVCLFHGVPPLKHFPLWIFLCIAFFLSIPFHMAEAIKECVC